MVDLRSGGGSDCLDREDLLLDKDFTKLANFSRFLGMPIEGFEVEIWTLVKKLRTKSRCGTPSRGWKKKP